MIDWQVLERLIANETMYEVIGTDGEQKTYGGLFPTEEDAKQMADRLNEAQK